MRVQARRKIVRDHVLSSIAVAIEEQVESGGVFRRLPRRISGLLGRPAVKLGGASVFRLELCGAVNVQRVVDGFGNSELFGFIQGFPGGFQCRTFEIGFDTIDDFGLAGDLGSWSEK